MSKSTKFAKKLILTTETLRVLDDAAVNGVVGGLAYYKPGEEPPAPAVVADRPRVETAGACWSQRIAVCGIAPQSGPALCGGR